MNADLDLRAAGGASATLFLKGAHLASWKPAGHADSALFLSAMSAFAPGTAIRGGVPLIFPQFAAEGPLPKHGFARTAQWTLLGTERHADGGASAQLQLRSDPQTLAIWPHPFRAIFNVRIGGTRLQMRLAIENTGDAPCRFTAALHTYLRIDALSGARVHGLQHLRYRDTANGGTEHTETTSVLAIERELDRIYFDTPATLQLTDGDRRIELNQHGFRDTVVWNPGAERAAALSDLEPGGWQRMLCIEAAAVGRPIELAPGERWQGGQDLRLTTA